MASNCRTSFDTDRHILNRCWRAAKNFIHMWAVCASSSQLGTQVTSDSKLKPTANGSEGSSLCRLMHVTELPSWIHSTEVNWTTSSWRFTTQSATWFLVDRSYKLGVIGIQVRIQSKRQPAVLLNLLYIGGRETVLGPTSVGLYTTQVAEWT